jgi:hypothetical protein
MLKMIHPSGDAWKHFHKSVELSRSSFTYLRDCTLLYPEALQICGPGYFGRGQSFSGNPPLAPRSPRSSFCRKHEGAMNIPPLPSGTILLVEVGPQPKGRSKHTSARQGFVAAYGRAAHHRWSGRPVAAHRVRVRVRRRPAGHRIIASATEKRVMCESP